MSSVIQKFGDYVDREAPRNPDKVRRRILTAYRLFGWYQKHFPDKRKPASRKYLADQCMNFMIKGFSHPENAAMVSMFMPCEILQAFHLNPMCAEMFSTYLNGAGAEKAFVDAAEEAGISGTYCSYHKVLIGAAKTGVLPKTKCIINTSLACDANNLTFRSLAQMMEVSQHYIDVPYRRNEISVEYVAGQLREMTEALEKETGRPFDENKLKEAVERSAQTLRLLNETIPYRKTKYLAGDLTSQLYEALMLHNALGSEEALQYARLLLEDYRNAPEGHGKKIVWMHTNPFWQKCVKDYLNYNEDINVTATELSYDVQVTDENGSSDTLLDTSDPYVFMARRLVYDAYNGPVTDRIAATRKTADQVQADGVVVFCHWGCKETCGASGQIKDALEKAGYPCLVLNGDGVDRHNTSDGQVSTRIGAFMEMLETSGSAANDTEDA